MRTLKATIGEWRERWRRPPGTEGLSALQSLRSPFGRVNEREDFRGLDLHSVPRIAGIGVHNVDLSGAVLKETWIESCVFENVLFAKTELDHVSDHSNRFARCCFHHASMRAMGLGYDGSRFERCIFQRCNFARTVYAWGEFDDCVFENCRLQGSDFNGTSFERCRFVGDVHDVWFHGQFAFEEDLRKQPHARRNRMLEVDLSEADLRGVTLSDGCDLSTVQLPSSGRYRLYDKAPRRVAHLREQSEAWPAPEAEYARAFVEAYRREGQEWLLINLDEEVEEARKRCGEYVVERMLHALEGYTGE